MAPAPELTLAVACLGWGGELKFPPPQSWASRDVPLAQCDVHCPCSPLAGACRVAVVQGCQVKGVIRFMVTGQVMGVGGAYCPCLRRTVARFVKSSQLCWRPSPVLSDRWVVIGRRGLHRGSSDDPLKIGNVSDPSLVVCNGDGFSRRERSLARSKKNVTGPQPAKLLSYGSTGSLLPPPDLGCAGHGDQEGGGEM